MWHFLNRLIPAFVGATLAVMNLSVSAAPFAYITNQLDNNVSVIDTASDTVVATIAVGRAPVAVAVNSASTRVYIANRYDNNVSVIDTASNTVVATFAVETQPLGVAVNPAGTRAYVTNFSSDSVSVIDTASNTVVATVPVGSEPTGVAVNPAGTLAYVVNQTNADFLQHPGNVSVIDTASNTVVDSVTVGSIPLAVAINPAGTRVYVTNLSGSVSVIDTASNIVVDTVTAGLGCEPWGVAINPAGTRAYITNVCNNGVVSVIDTASNTVVATVPIGFEFEPTGVAVNPAGTRIYVANSSAASVSVIDAASNTVVHTIAVGIGPSAFGLFIGPAPLAAPIDSPRITQDFACYNCFKDGQTKPFHTGLDMTSKSAPATNTLVSPAATGVVEAIYFSRDKTNTVCDLSNPGNDVKVSTLTNLTDDRYDNKGFGNVIILRHGETLFTLYGHLKCIERHLAENFLAATMTGGAAPRVTQADKIGKLGGSGRASMTTYPLHLHFEVKTAGVLNAPNNTTDFGYSTNPPDTLGYSDPVLLISNKAPVELNPTVVVRVQQNGVNVRPGPAYDDAFNVLQAGIELVAFRTMEVEGMLWYQVDLAVPISNLNNCGTVPQCNNDGTEGWISGELAARVASSVKVQIGIDAANMMQDKHDAPGNTVIAKGFRSQEFVVVGTRNADKACGATWYKVFLGNIRTPSSATQGWLCGADLAL